MTNNPLNDVVSLQITFAQTTGVLEFEKEEFNMDNYIRGHDDTPRAKLLPEIKEWCIENLRGNMAHPRVVRVYAGSQWSFVWAYYIDFKNEHDAILFKLRWIG